MAYYQGNVKGKNRLAHPQFSVTMIARRGGQWMRNPGGKEFFRVHPVSFRKGRWDRRPAEKPRLKPACSREEPPPWSPKESLSSQGLGPHTKLGVGLFYLLRFFPQKSAPGSPNPRIAVPLVSTATRFPFDVYSYASSASFSISRTGSATPGV